MEAVSKAVKAGGAKKALAVCDGHDGPVSNICKAGLEKSGKGADQVEKAIENAGSLEMAFLEKNMGWANCNCCYCSNDGLHRNCGA